jgi:hypothetical protein
MDKFQVIFLSVSILSPLIPLWVGRNEKTSLVWLYMAAALCFDLLINTNKRVLYFNHYWLANLFVLAEYMFISFIYKPLLFKRSVLFCMTLITFALYFVFTTLANSVWKFNTKGASIFHFIYILFAIAGMYKLLIEQKVLFMENDRTFWLHCAFLIYGSGNFLLFLFTDHLMTTDNKVFQLLWAIFFLFISTTSNVLLAIALSRKKIATHNELK